MKTTSSFTLRMLRIILGLAVSVYLKEKAPDKNSLYNCLSISAP